MSVTAGVSATVIMVAVTTTPKIGHPGLLSPPSSGDLRAPAAQC
jgi:hypothetical protein